MSNTHRRVILSKCPNGFPYSKMQLKVAVEIILYAFAIFSIFLGGRASADFAEKGRRKAADEVNTAPPLP